MIIFDGKSAAARHKLELQEKVKEVTQLSIYSLVFQEDTASSIYANLKKKDAEFLGIVYEIETLPIATPIEKVRQHIHMAVHHHTGIIVQKPVKSLEPYDGWWAQIVDAIPVEKDLDGLRPDTRVLPATARAILTILDEAIEVLGMRVEGKVAVVLGRSDIVGRPVADELEKRYGMTVHRFGRKEFAEHPEKLKEADLVVAATGQSDLVNASQLKQGVVVIDAGSPKPEVNPEGLGQVVSFLSPVPGGVGPMTRICLLENLVDLSSASKE